LAGILTKWEKWWYPAYSVNLNPQGGVYSESSGLSPASSYGPNLSTGTWYHVVYFYDGSKIGMYVNTVPYDHKSVKGQPISNQGNVIIGWTNVAFKGAIDEVRIYNRALSACEVCELCRAYWTKAQCNNCTDCSGN